MNKYKRYAKQFRNELKLYNSKQAELRDIEDKLIELETKMYEVAGISYEEKPQTTSPNAYRTPMLNEIELHEKLISKRDYILFYIDGLDNMLNECCDDVKGMLVDMYINEYGSYRTSQRYHRSEKQMYRDIEKGLCEVYKRILPY